MYRFILFPLPERQLAQPSLLPSSFPREKKNVAARAPRRRPNRPSRRTNYRLHTRPSRLQTPVSPDSRRPTSIPAGVSHRPRSGSVADVVCEGRCGGGVQVIMHHRFSFPFWRCPWRSGQRDGGWNPSARIYEVKL